MVCLGLGDVHGSGQYCTEFRQQYCRASAAGGCRRRYLHKERGLYACSHVLRPDKSLEAVAALPPTPSVHHSSLACSRIATSARCCVKARPVEVQPLLQLPPKTPLSHRSGSKSGNDDPTQKPSGARATAAGSAGCGPQHVQHVSNT